MNEHIPLVEHSISLHHGYIRRTTYGLIASGILLISCADTANNSQSEPNITIETAETPVMTTFNTSEVPSGTYSQATRQGQAEPGSSTTDSSSLGTVASSVPAENCGLRSVDVGQNFTESNSEKITKDLDLLARLKANNDLDLRDIWTTASIIHQSREDPLFAEAINKANEQIKAGNMMDTDQFLNQQIDYPILCTEGRISEDDLEAQLYHTVVISDYVLSEMASSFTESSLDAVNRLYDSVRQEYEDLPKDDASGSAGD